MLALRGWFAGVNVNDSGSFWRARASSDLLDGLELFDGPGETPMTNDQHNSGHWITQPDEDEQWMLNTSYNPAQYPAVFVQSLGFIRISDRDVRLLCHHYAGQPRGEENSYRAYAMGHISPDGRIVIFNSRMNNDGAGIGPGLARVELFAAEVPLR